MVNRNFPVGFPLLSLPTLPAPPDPCFLFWTRGVSQLRVMLAFWVVGSYAAGWTRNVIFLRCSFGFINSDFDCVITKKSLASLSIVKSMPSINFSSRIGPYAHARNISFSNSFINTRHTHCSPKNISAKKLKFLIILMSTSGTRRSFGALSFLVY